MKIVLFCFLCLSATVSPRPVESGDDEEKLMLLIFTDDLPSVGGHRIGDSNTQNRGGMQESQMQSVISYMLQGFPPMMSYPGYGMRYPQAMVPAYDNFYGYQRVMPQAPVPQLQMPQVPQPQMSQVPQPQTSQVAQPQTPQAPQTQAPEREPLEVPIVTPQRTPEPSCVVPEDNRQQEDEVMQVEPEPEVATNEVKVLEEPQEIKPERSQAGNEVTEEELEKGVREAEAVAETITPDEPEEISVKGDEEPVIKADADVEDQALTDVEGRTPVLTVF